MICLEANILKIETWMMKNYTIVDCSFEFDENNLKITKPYFRMSKIAFLGVFKLCFNLVKMNVVLGMYIFRWEYVFFFNY